jgi:hypothetical protein
MLEKLESLEQEVFISFTCASILRQVLGIVDSVLDWWPFPIRIFYVRKYKSLRRIYVVVFWGKCSFQGCNALTTTTKKKHLIF